VGGGVGGLDAGPAKFGDEPALEGSFDALDPAASLWGFGEDGLDGQAVHGDLKAGGLVIPLEWMGAAVAGSRNLAGFVEVQAIGEAVTSEDVVKHLETGITRLVRCDQPLQWPAGGIVGRKHQSQHGQVRPEPKVRAAIE
jgi:hypothetical protein